VEGSCEHGNETPGSIKCWGILEYQRLAACRGLSCEAVESGGQKAVIFDMTAMRTRDQYFASTARNFRHCCERHCRIEWKEAWGGWKGQGAADFLFKVSEVVGSVLLSGSCGVLVLAAGNSGILCDVTQQHCNGT
jgi:hypothetical protein